MGTVVAILNIIFGIIISVVTIPFILIISLISMVVIGVNNFGIAMIKGGRSYIYGEDTAE